MIDAMMTQQLGFSLITAPLAAIDRRSLSQAWYSALHLASDRTTHAPERTSPPLPAAGERRVRNDEGYRAHDAARPAQVRGAGTSGATSLRDIAVERRTMRSSLARRIERRFLNPRAPARRATFTIEGTNARVHIAMQTHGSSVRLVAICAPSVRATVARALDDARYSLARRGIALCIEGEPSC